MEILVKYFVENLEPIKFTENGDWIDLRCAIPDGISMLKDQFKLIPLGIGIKLPKGYEAHVAPRSSTYKNFGIIQTNSVAVIDESYCGDGDQWFLPAYALRDTRINFNDRICQFRIIKKQPKFIIKETKVLEDKDRGGLGSTGIK